ncbi:hypothetical protein BC939DRAFT_76210 [Gamsiella multidivaricata]|uniref:uncharacterized protein n=1 Tax=Gamsiella multidivaricata TaxID=101098 RepID=UPI00221F0406|nr:uncharacterized protein BC939DRAFT_76210 [Gamsiella multidivaricata]KAI7827961.1 hypothetical protein BC939DRAFT_76210 [Gamsiella multidivaricata]
MQGRGGRQPEHTQQRWENMTSIPPSTQGSSPTVKAKSSYKSRSSKEQTPPKSQPTVISHESHPLLRLFMNHKSASEEDVSASYPMLSSQGPHLVSSPMTLTIPNLEEITNARLASRSPVPNPDANAMLDQTQLSGLNQQHQHQPTPGIRPVESARLPFGFNVAKPFRFDRRPSAPVLMGSAPGPDYPFHNHHVLNRGAVSSSPLSSPRAVPPPPQSSILSSMHIKQGTSDSDGSTSLPPANKGSFSHEIIIPSHLLTQQQNARPSSTPASPAIPPTAVVASASNSTSGSIAVANTSLGSSKDLARLTGQRRPSPTIPSSMVGLSQQQSQQQQQQNRVLNDSRSNLPPAIPHRKASLDFSQTERYSHLRPSLPMRPPSAAAVRSSTFHGLESGSGMGSAHSSESASSASGMSYTGSIAGISSGIAALSMQPINISEEKLPPFGHSPAHLRMINALPDSAFSAAHDQHRGSITSSDKDGLSPGSNINSDPTFGQLSNPALTNHAISLSSSSTSSVSSASVSTPAAATGGFTTAGSGSGPGVVMARPGLRTVGSSENFARRIRSASMLRRNEEQEGISKSSFQSSRPPHVLGSFSAQQAQQPTLPQAHFHQHPAYYQQQYSYAHESNSADIHRYRRASSPRRRSISMTNLNGGLSVIMIPPKKVRGPVKLTLSRGPR